MPFYDKEHKERIAELENLWVSLHEIYVMPPQSLEPIYQHWEEKLRTMPHLNNPKIPVKYVRENGILVYPIHMPNPIDPDSINA